MFAASRPGLLGLCQSGVHGGEGLDQLTVRRSAPARVLMPPVVAWQVFGSNSSGLRRI